MGSVCAAGPGFPTERCAKHAGRKGSRNTGDCLNPGNADAVEGRWLKAGSDVKPAWTTSPKVSANSEKPCWVAMAVAARVAETMIRTSWNWITSMTTARSTGGRPDRKARSTDGQSRTISHRSFNFSAAVAIGPRLGRVIALIDATDLRLVRLRWPAWGQGAGRPRRPHAGIP